jgi:hypothetical protein
VIVRLPTIARPEDAFAPVRNQNESLGRRTGVKAPLVVLALAFALLAACSGPTQNVSPTTTEPVSTTTSEPAPPLSARVVMSSTTMHAGATVDAQVIVENNTGSALHVTGCGSLFQVALSSDTIEPNIAWPACAQPLTVPVGESVYPVTVSAKYQACGDGGTLPPCGTAGDLPALPPGDYQARLYQNPVVVPAPPPVAIRVTP